MSSLAESISYPQAALGGAIGLLVLGLVALDVYAPPFPVAVAVIALAVVLAARGLRPFGETVGYSVLQAAAFGGWGVAVLLSESGGLRVVPAVFAVAGTIGVLYYGRLAVRRGPWEPIDG